MLEYEWGNPSTIMLTGDDPHPQDTDQNRQIFDHYSNPTHTFQDQTNHNPNLIPQPNPTLFNHPPQPPPHHHQTHLNSLYDARAYATSSYGTPHPSLLPLDHVSAAAATAAPSYFIIPKSEEVSRQADFSARIGLNLGGRTYFSSAEDDFVNRLYRRSRPALDSGSGLSNINSAPRCQAEGCNADLTHAKHYHRRHKVCEFHSKASTVIAAGLTQRFCQQCSRFHLLSEFDNGKRSCRKRLADHNRRRRKSHQTNTQDSTHKSQHENARDSSSENLTRSPQDSGAHSSSSVTVAVSPPRMTLDCFKQRAFQAAASSSSLFFLSG